MKAIANIILAVSLLWFTGGCQTTKPQTQEAVVFNSFASTWAIALAAYDGYSELAVQGKVSAEDQRDIDRAWNRFRETFKFALRTSQNNWQATSPDEVTRLKDDLIILIRSL
jgi:hypothetical protein